MRLLSAAVALLVLAPFPASAQSLSLNGYHLTYDWEANSFEPTQLRANAPKGALTTTLEHGWRTLATAANPAQASQEEQCYEDNSFGTNPFSLPGNGTLQTTTAPGFAYCPGPSGNVGAAYRSGIISTEGNFSQTYGYFEARIKMPAGAGMWPAFWMATASGAEFPEIDVTEQLGAPPHPNWQGGALWTHWDVHSAKISGNSVGAWVKVPNTQTGFHAYGVLWTPKTIGFYFDGGLIGQIATPADANVPMYMEANVAVGGSSAGPPSNETAKMQIDYIRAFASGSGAAVPLQPISSPDGGGKTLYGAKHG